MTSRYEAFPGPDAEAIRRLSRFVEREAKRLLNDEQLEGDPELIAQGWERRFITDHRRAEEMADLYRTLGMDVRLEPVEPDDVGEDCGDCQLVRSQFCMLYTRGRTPEGVEEGNRPE